MPKALLGGTVFHPAPLEPTVGIAQVTGTGRKATGSAGP
jgi:hypothetical protein